MEQSYADKAVDKIHERFTKVKAKFHEQYKRKKPFRQDEMSRDEQLFIYDNMEPEDLDYIISTYGEDTVNQMLFEMGKRRR